MQRFSRLVSKRVWGRWRRPSQERLSRWKQQLFLWDSSQFIWTGVQCRLPGKVILRMTYCFAFFADRPTFGASLSLKKNLFLKKKRGLSYGYNILLEAPVLGKCHLMEETQMWTLNFGATKCSSACSPSLDSILSSLHSLHSHPWRLRRISWFSMTRLRRKLEYHSHARNPPIDFH